jgi:hypothetical protein
MSERTERRAITVKRVQWALSRMNKCKSCGGLPVVDDRRKIQFDGRGDVTIKCGHRCCVVVRRDSFALAVRAWNRVN